MHQFQESRQLDLVCPRKSRHHRAIEVSHWGIQPSQQLQALRQDTAPDLATVIVGAYSHDQFLLLQSINQPGDAWRLLDHPFRDGEGAQTLRARAAENAEHIELLWRKPVRCQECRAAPPQGVGGPEDADYGGFGVRGGIVPVHGRIV